MTIAELLKPSQIVLDQNGQVAAVQSSIATWQALIEQLEDVEDRATVRAALSKLRAGPQQGAALHWEDIRVSWD